MPWPWLEVVDVGNAAAPREVAFHVIKAWEAQPVAAAGDCAYVAEGGYGLAIICRSNVTPTSPALMYLPLVAAG